MVSVVAVYIPTAIAGFLCAGTKVVRSSPALAVGGMTRVMAEAWCRRRGYDVAEYRDLGLKQFRSLDDAFINAILT